MPIALILFVVLTGLEIVILARAASTGRIPSVGGAMVARADMAGTYWFMIVIHGLILALFGGLTIWLACMYFGFG